MSNVRIESPLWQISPSEKWLESEQGATSRIDSKQIHRVPSSLNAIVSCTLTAHMILLQSRTIDSETSTRSILRAAAACFPTSTISIILVSPCLSLPAPHLHICMSLWLPLIYMLCLCLSPLLASLPAPCLFSAYPPIPAPCLLLSASSDYCLFFPVSSPSGSPLTVFFPPLR